MNSLHRFLSLPLALPPNSPAVFLWEERNVRVPRRKDPSQGWGSSLSVSYSALGTCCSWYHSKIYSENMDELPNSVAPSDPQYLVRQLCTQCRLPIGRRVFPFPTSLSTSPWTRSWAWSAATRPRHKKPKSVTNTSARLRDGSLREQSAEPGRPPPSALSILERHALNRACQNFDVWFFI